MAAIIVVMVFAGRAAVADPAPDEAGLSAGRSSFGLSFECDRWGGAGTPTDGGLSLVSLVPEPVWMRYSGAVHGSPDLGVVGRLDFCVRLGALAGNVRAGDWQLGASCLWSKGYDGMGRIAWPGRSTWLENLSWKVAGSPGPGLGQYVFVTGRATVDGELNGSSTFLALVMLGTAFPCSRMTEAESVLLYAVVPRDGDSLRWHDVPALCKRAAPECIPGPKD